MTAGSKAGSIRFNSGGGQLHCFDLTITPLISARSFLLAIGADRTVSGHRVYYALADKNRYLNAAVLFAPFER